VWQGLRLGFQTSSNTLNGLKVTHESQQGIPGWRRAFTVAFIPWELGNDSGGMGECGRD
jgi:hypothetical protein